MLSLVLSVTVFAVSTMAAAFDVATGYQMSCAAYAGNVKCWGRNDFGQLGLGTEDAQHNEPGAETVDLGTDSSGESFYAETVDCGHWQCCALSSSHELKCWGWCHAIGCPSDAGYGDGDWTDSVGDAAGEVPMAMTAVFSDVVDVVTLQTVTCVLENPQQGTYAVECVGKDNGENLWGGDYEEVVRIGDTDAPVSLDMTTPNTWTEVSGLGGGHFTLCAWDSNTAGALQCWGSESTDAAPCSDCNDLYIEDVQCGHNHCCALGVDSSSETGERSLVCWAGSTNEIDVSQLGEDFEVQDFFLPIQATCALSTLGEVKCFGSLSHGAAYSFVIPPDYYTQSDVRLARSGYQEHHYCIYEEAADELLLQCWGHNLYGQLGLGDIDNRESVLVDADGNDLEEANLEFVNLQWEVVPGDDGAHYVARGNPTSGHFEDDNGEVVFYCQSDSTNQADYLSTRSELAVKDKVAVSCCSGSGDGVSGWRPDVCPVESDYAANYAAAEQFCSDNGRRLCTLQEMLSGATKGEGCYYDHAYNWVSDACDLAEDEPVPSPALVNARLQSDPLTVEDEDGSSDGPAGNGLADLSTTSLIGVIGAAIGAVAVVAMVLGIVSAAKRRKRAGMAEETQIAVELGMDKAAVDSVESVTAEMPSENGTAAAAATKGDVAVEVAVEIVATKPDDAVSVQQEQ